MATRGRKRNQKNAVVKNREWKHLTVTSNCELRVYFNQTRICDCWNNGDTNQDGVGEFYFLSVEFEMTVFNNELTGQLSSFLW